MRREAWLKAALLVISTGLSVLAFEIAVRALIRPSPDSYGTLLGRELPPLCVIPAQAPLPASASPARGGELDGLTWGDLQGVMREDPVLGYAPLEGSTSSHGWWTVNELGARSATETPAAKAPGTRRILVFGESFASGSRVRQEDAWATRLATDGVETVNLAVDGYAMGQSLLRFRALAPRLDYDLAMLVFVPAADLWRDVNVIRSLAKPDWQSYTPMPRFVVDGGVLTLVPSPYASVADVYADNADGLGDTLRRHLIAYERFYFRSWYESPPLVGDLVLWKIAATVYATAAKARLLGRMGVGHVDLDCEAMRVSHAIFATMRDEVERAGKRFVLVILPEHSGLKKARADARAAANWREMVAALCAGGIACIDVAPALVGAAPADLDRGRDGTHYGPRMHRLAAAAIADGLRRFGLP